MTVAATSLPMGMSLRPAATGAVVARMGCESIGGEMVNVGTITLRRQVLGNRMSEGPGATNTPTLLRPTLVAEGLTL